MKINNDILFNVLFWLLYSLYQWLGLASLYTGYDKYFINACMALPVSFLFSVLTVHVFFKRFYHPNNKFIICAAVFMTSIALLLIRRYINYKFIYPRYFPQAMWLPFFSFGKILVEFVNLYAVTALYALYYFTRSLYQERNRSLGLLQQKTLAELNTLKAQVKPHFVFNTLNNIYATALKNSPEAAALIAHLSGFLDYNLYESAQEKVALATEIAYLEHYLELQKNRYSDKLDLSFNVYDSFDGFLIAPLLLLPMVENCFTHGVANAMDKSWVKIDFSKKANKLSIKIENSKEEQVTEIDAKPCGIGLSNVKKRLDLIYPGMHEITVTDNTDSFFVVIKLKNLGND